MKYSFLSLSFLLLFACAYHEKSEETDNERLPNIIHIFTDDLGYGDIGCFGATDIKTPNIDRMAAEGIKFTAFYSGSSICSPSRAALLTGRFPQRMGINAVFFPESFTGMAPAEITIPELLKAKNYATGMVGKWHLGHHEKFLPLQQGFDSYFGIPYSNDMASCVYMRDNEVEAFKVDQRYTTKKYTEEAMNFIDENKTQPFFLYLAHSMPHVPLYASEDFLGSSERGLYGDVIQEIDWSVGEILNKLSALNLLENTLIVFSSDNGPWLVMEDHGGSAGAFREGKMFTFEGGMRVPTLAMWKGKIPAGITYDQLATQMDWFPTFGKIAGIDIPEAPVIDGVDISNVLFSKGDRAGDAFLFYEGSQLQGYRKGNWKLKLPYAGFPGTPWKHKVAAHDTLLINLKEDEGELENRFKENRDLANALILEMKNAAERIDKLPSLEVSSGADESHFDYLAKKRKR